jgi:hypothetical protein
MQFAAWASLSPTRIVTFNPIHRKRPFPLGVDSDLKNIVDALAGDMKCHEVTAAAIVNSRWTKYIHKWERKFAF